MKEVLNAVYNFDDFVLGVCTIIPAFIQFWVSLPEIKRVIYKNKTHNIGGKDIFVISIKIICLIVLISVGLCSIMKNVSIVVPSVENMSYDNATQTLKELGIKFSSDVSVNNIKEYYVKEWCLV